MGTGKGVTIYTIDSGIRQSHQEFQAWSGGHGRASYGCAFISLSSLCHFLRILCLVGQQLRNMGGSRPCLLHFYATPPPCIIRWIAAWLCAAHPAPPCRAPEMEIHQPCGSLRRVTSRTTSALKACIGELQAKGPFIVHQGTVHDYQVHICHQYWPFNGTSQKRVMHATGATLRGAQTTGTRATVMATARMLPPQQPAAQWESPRKPLWSPCVCWTAMAAAASAMWWPVKFALA